MRERYGANEGELGDRRGSAAVVHLKQGRVAGGGDPVRPHLTLVAGLFFAGLAVPHQFAVAEPAPSASVAESKRTEVLGEDWRSSGDRTWTTIGDGKGFHVLTAEARTGYSWCTVATSTQPGLDADSWIGNACLTASGQRLVVVYAPRVFTNEEELFDRCGFTAIADLGSGGTGTARDKWFAEFLPS